MAGAVEVGGNTTSDNAAKAEWWRKPPSQQTVEQIARAWVWEKKTYEHTDMPQDKYEDAASGTDLVMDLLYHAPESALAVIDSVVEQSEGHEWVLSMLGAGPIEDLLRSEEFGDRFHDAFVERVRASPNYRRAVQSVWAPSTPLPEELEELVAWKCGDKGRRW